MKPQIIEQMQDASPAGDCAGWQLRKIDVRSPVDPAAWPVARLELYHPDRGRVTDIASAPGAFDAAFKAAAQIVGIAPRLVSFDVTSAAPAAEGALSIQLEIRVEIDGRIYRGSSFGVDLCRCAVSAWLQAASRVHAEGPWNFEPSRPFQLRGTDENDDLWIFASQDEGATDAIAREFREEGYSDIQRIAAARARPGAAGDIAL